ncbi:MAG: hypothetical protein HZY76_17340 [Anaerolineae bacterium]|nr:MAG: hypothetical protein HZY76_17340 [Anaerolineae bacterium]
MQKRVLVVLLVGLTLLLSAAPALAQDGADGDRVIIGQSFRLNAGEHLRGNLAVMGGSVDIEEDATLTGDIVVFGGSLRVAGQVIGDVVTFGGSVDLPDTAHVSGDVAVLGDRCAAPGATIGGTVRETQGRPSCSVAPPHHWSYRRRRPRPLRFLFDALMSTLGAVGISLVLATLGVLAVVLLPKQIERVAQVLVARPAIALAAGILTWLVITGLVVILAITICLAPLAVLLLAMAALAWLAGWIAAGWLVGQRLLQALNLKNPSPLLEAIVGVVLITLLWRVVPCIGWLFWFVISSLGLGSVVLALSGRPPTGQQTGPASMALLPPSSVAPSNPAAGAAPGPSTPWYQDMPADLLDDLAADADARTVDDEPPQ